MSSVSTRTAALALLIACGSTPAQTQDFASKQGPIRLVQVARGLEHPWSLAFLPDGRMLVTERPGRGDGPALSHVELRLLIDHTENIALARVGQEATDRGRKRIRLHPE
jgi:glucose/arabinose dehydrogenase